MASMPRSRASEALRELGLGSDPAGQVQKKQPWDHEAERNSEDEIGETGADPMRAMRAGSPLEFHRASSGGAEACS